MNQRSQRYHIGDQIHLRSASSKIGFVIKGPRQYPGGDEYFLAINGGSGWYAEGDIELVSSKIMPRWENYDKFLRDLLLAKLSSPLSDSLYSYRASRTVYEPYQFRPALKFLLNPDQRILIADEVGLGKTIEACIIYLELKARLDISRILILCPSRLKTKWRDELRNRFEEEFTDLDAAGFNRLLADYRRTSGALSFRAIASFESLRRSEILDDMIESQLALDLLIVDEAHHMRNQETSTHQVGSILSDTADAVVFLTATPLHLGNEDLFHLLSILSPGDYNDPYIFSQLVYPNTHINRAAQLIAAGKVEETRHELLSLETTTLRDRFIGNPYYDSVMLQLVNDNALSNPHDRVLLQRQVLELNTLSSIFTRTRKREVSHAAVRAAYTINVILSPEEEAFYRGVLDNVRYELRSRGYSAISFALVMKERIAASCLAALRQSYEDAQQTHATANLQLEQGEFDLFDSDNNGDASTRQQSYLLQLSRKIGGQDSKYDLFLNILKEVLTEDSDTKVLVFSTFRRTLEYLQKRLLSDGFLAGVIHGNVKIIDRQAIIDDLRTNPHSRILLSSEVGAEGLDFQFCDVLINYDLPWNPMQVEQRIGRLDRFGQQHDRIRIYNFYLNNTIETRIFQRLYDRINIFQQSIGDLETILGEEIRELSRQVLQESLTPEEEEKLAEEAAVRIVKRQQAEEELEQHKHELLGQDVILNQQLNDTIETGRVIHPREVSALVATFIKQAFPQVELTCDHEEPTWTVTVSPQLAAFLHEHQSENRNRRLLCSERFREAITLNKQIAFTFDSEYARQRPLLEFVTYNHLLADAAKNFWIQSLAGDGIPALNGISIKGQAADVGRGYFFIYAIDEHSIQDKRTLHPVIVLEDGRIATHSARTLMGQLQRGAYPSAILVNESFLTQAEERASQWIAGRRDTIRRDAEQQILAVTTGRSVALQQSFKAKIGRIRETRAKVSDPRLHRLYDGQMRNLEAQLETRLAKLQEGQSISVSYDLISMGRIEITPLSNDA